MQLSTSEASEERTERTERASSAIGAFLDACGYTKKISEHRALGLWHVLVEEHVGPDAAQASVAQEVRNGELIVAVPKAAWRHRLTFETPRLVQILNTRLGSEAILSIRLV
jgi:predicted nucleic acid-binding Zn ribbon protein